MLKVVIIESRSVSSLFMMVRGANSPLIIAWKVSNTLGSFSFFKVKLESCVFWLADSFQAKVERSSSASCSHFHCLLLENFVLWQCSLLIRSTSSLECNHSGSGVVYLGYDRSIFLMLCDDQKCLPTQKMANCRSLSPLSFVSSLQMGPQMPCQFPQASLLTFAFQSPCTARMSLFGV